MNRLTMAMLVAVLTIGASQATAQNNSVVPSLTDEQKRQMYQAKRERLEQVRKERDAAKRARAAALIMEKAAQR